MTHNIGETMHNLRKCFRKSWPAALVLTAVVALACQPSTKPQVSEEVLRAFIEEEVSAQLTDPSEANFAKLDAMLSDTDGFVGRELFNLRLGLEDLRNKLGGPGFNQIDSSDVANLRFDLEDLRFELGAMGVQFAPVASVDDLHFKVASLDQSLENLSFEYAFRSDVDAVRRDLDGLRGAMQGLICS